MRIKITKYVIDRTIIVNNRIIIIDVILIRTQTFKKTHGNGVNLPIQNAVSVKCVSEDLNL